MYQFYNRNYKMNVCVYQNNLFTKYISMFSDVNEVIQNIPFNYNFVPKKPLKALKIC